MNVGIIGDGATDYQILLKMVECAVPWDVNGYELGRQSFRDAVDRYWRDSDRAEDCWFPQKPALDLRKAVSGVLHGAFDDFQKMVGSFTDHDLLVVSTDTECHLQNSDLHFSCWVLGFTKIFVSGIEHFYHNMLNQGYEKGTLPLIVSILPFPSTDILVAVAKGETGFYGRDARELKRMLYDTTNLATIPPEDFEELALRHITLNGINLIFKRVPESRFFINFLSAIGRNGHSD